jgi:hypothetical protein
MAVNELPSIVSATEDVNTLANPLFVQVSDGTDAGQNPGTDATNLGKAVDSAGGATDTGVATLVLRDDALTTLTPVDGDYVRLRVDSTGALWTRPTQSGDQSNVFVDDSAFTVATDTVGSIGLLADETATDSVDEGDIGIPRMSLDRRTLTDSTLQIGDADVSASVPVPISATEAANTELNPIFVHTTNTVLSGNEVHDYDTATVTAASSDTHDYGVTGTTFLWKSAILASSGPFYFTLSSGPTAGTADFASAFLNGREGDTQQLNFDPARECPVASTGVARITRFNRHSGIDNDVFTTIIGNDV